MTTGRRICWSFGTIARRSIPDNSILIVACITVWAATAPQLQAAVLQRPPQGSYGLNDIIRGGKTTPSIRDVMHPPNAHHLLLPTSSEQPIKQIPPPPPPPSLESLRPTPSLRTSPSTYYGGLHEGSSWGTAEGVLGQPQFRLLWATEGSSSPVLEDVTKAATPASLTPHTT